MRMRYGITRGMAAMLVGLLAAADASGQGRIIDVAAGAGHTLLLREDGKAFSFGTNGSGQLGSGTATSASPVPVLGSDLIAGVEAGIGHSVLLAVDGTVRVFGQNSGGQLGLGMNGNTIPVPTVVAGLAGVRAMDGGASHTLFLMEDGTVRAVGFNLLGQLGTGTSLSVFSPVVVPGFPPRNPVDPGQDMGFAVRVSAGFYHSLVLRRNGQVMAFGDGSSGQLGLGTGVASALPAAVPGLPAAAEVSAGNLHSLVLARNGAVYAFGSNADGQLGNGTTSSSGVPVPVLLPPGIVAIAAGGNHGLALTAGGTVWAFGDNLSGQIGDGTTVDRPSPVAVLGGVVAIAAGDSHSVALLADGSVKTWGSNFFSQLGIAGATSSPVPVAPPALAPPAAPVYARVSVKRVHGATGSPWTDADVQSFMDVANQLFAGTGLQFQYAQAADLIDWVDPRFPMSWLSPLPSPVTSLESFAKHEPCFYRWRHDAINIYLAASDFGEASFATGSPAEKTVVIGRFVANGGVALAHELGHFFGLRHTHANHETGAGAGCAGGAAGDCVADTMDDADPAPCHGSTTSAASFHACHAAALDALAATLGYTAAEKDDVRWNVMSYHGPIAPAQARFTPGQKLRIRAGITARQDLLVNAVHPLLAAGSPAQAGYPTAQLLALQGSGLPVAGVTVEIGEGQRSTGIAGGPTAVTAAFSGPLEPGVHCARLFETGDRLVAFLPAATVITPALTLDRHAPSLTFTLTARSTVPLQAFLLLVGPTRADGLPVPGIGYELFIEPQVGAVFWFPWATDAQGLWSVTAPLGVLPQTELTAQIYEIAPSPCLSNPVRWWGY